MYGLLIATGIIISLLYAEKLVEAKDLSKDTYWKLVFWGIISGIIGARIYHVINLWEIYSKNPLFIFAIWNGGMGIFGGLVLALFVIWKLEKQNYLNWTDIFVRVLPLGQSIGRWGNYFNKELLPFALYESGLDMLLFILINAVARKKLQRGVLSGIYLIGYSTIRIVLEPLRTDHWMFQGLNVTYLVSLAIIAVTLLTLWKTKKTEN